MVNPGIQCRLVPGSNAVQYLKGDLLLYTIRTGYFGKYLVSGFSCIIREPVLHVYLCVDFPNCTAHGHYLSAAWGWQPERTRKPHNLTWKYF